MSSNALYIASAPIKLMSPTQSEFINDMLVKQYENDIPINIDIIKLFITMYFLFLNAYLSLCINDVDIILLAMDIISMFFKSVMFSIF